MNKKEFLKKVIGEKNLIRIKQVLAVRRYVRANKCENVGKYILNTDILDECVEIKKNGYNIFFGYYDLNQLDKTGQMALIHIVKKKANPATDEAELGWYDMQSGKIHVFARTRAWSWQQGARLRWHPTREACVIYNDFDGKDYVTRIFDLDQNKVMETLPIALYDITPSGLYGLGLDFNRLQRLRPGYGYSCLKDPTESISVPENNGIFLWSAESGRVKTIIDLDELAASVPDKNVEHYINHISISPSGQKFLFFHLWSYGPGMLWNMKLYVCNMDGTGLKCVEDEAIISHYCWNGDDFLLTTALADDKINYARYIAYDLKMFSKKTIESDHLGRDGHPSMINGNACFISDTYPQDDSMQYVFASSLDGRKYTQLLSVYANPFLVGEHRCDLHPRVDIRHGVISVDTTYTGTRSVMIARMKKEEPFG